MRKSSQYLERITRRKEKKRKEKKRKEEEEEEKRSRSVLQRGEDQKTSFLSPQMELKFSKEFRSFPCGCPCFSK